MGPVGPHGPHAPRTSGGRGRRVSGRAPRIHGGVSKIALIVPQRSVKKIVSKISLKSYDSAAEWHHLLFWIRAFLDTPRSWIRFAYGLDTFWIRFGYGGIILDTLWIRALWIRFGYVLGTFWIRLGLGYVLDTF